MDFDRTLDDDGLYVRKLSWGYNEGLGIIAHTVNNTQVMNLDIYVDSTGTPYNESLSVGGYPCLRSSDALKYQVIDSGMVKFSPSAYTATSMIKFNVAFEKEPYIICSLAVGKKPDGTEDESAKSILNNCNVYTHGYDATENTMKVIISNNTGSAANKASIVVYWIAIGTPA